MGGFLKSIRSVTVAALTLLGSRSASFRSRRVRRQAESSPPAPLERDRLAKDSGRRLTACYKRLAEVESSLAAEIGGRDRSTR